ncbi:MAG: isoleucine--tRNA ligase, partial [Vicinamibacterales bacterium]
FWVDMPDAYTTMSADYIESVWWSLRQIYDAGLLFEDYKVTPYCPRCGTPLSDHEVAQGYETVIDPSIFLRFPLTDEPGTSLLVWTTTPWTLISNVAAAIHPEVEYVAVESDGERLILAKPLVHRLFGPDARIVHHYAPGALDGRTYQPPFRFVEPDKPCWYVVSAEFVTTEDGSGIVHMAPAYGAEDMEVGRHHGLPVVHLVDEEGRFVDAVVPFAGRFVKDADADIIEDLRSRGLLVRAETVEHSYPLCWRCSTPLLYYARTSWYIRTTERKQRLLEENERLMWHPDHIRHGRFGDWLENNVDWALSRDRYWGTPLPIWRCQNKHTACIGSFAELSNRAGRDLAERDPHRPYIDEIAFACADCGSEMRRFSSVIDTWYDSGSMPFAQYHYPFENSDTFDTSFPTQFIAEAIDQTRGWFYTLLAISTLVFDRSSYERVLCLGHIVDKDGRKMSKSAGNVIDPWTILDAQGADALRWYMFTVGSPWTSRRVYPEAIDEVLRGFLRMLWNVYSFEVLYANTDGLDPSKIDALPVASRSVLDRWILAEMNDTVRTVTDGMESYDCTTAGRRIQTFVDDLSNWYVRRSRRRFWSGADDSDKRSAHATLYECLTTVSQLLAPFTPFVADELWDNLVCSVDQAAPDSVHLADWPSFDTSLIDEDLRTQMTAARRVVGLGLQAREQAKVKVRQPLARVVVTGATVEPALIAMVAEELNVKYIAHGEAQSGTFATASEGETTVHLDTTITPDLQAEGDARELVRGIQNLRKSSGFQVSDRITVFMDAPEEVWTQLAPHMDWIAAEVLAVSVERGIEEPATEVKLSGGPVSVHAAAVS